jgi:hypothetical protein
MEREEFAKAVLRRLMFARAAGRASYLGRSTPEGRVPVLGRWN